jgi:hypothetical protein
MDGMGGKITLNFLSCTKIEKQREGIFKTLPFLVFLILSSVLHETVFLKRQTAINCVC